MAVPSTPSDHYTINSLLGLRLGVMISVILSGILELSSLFCYVIIYFYMAKNNAVYSMTERDLPLENVMLALTLVSGQLLSVVVAAFLLVWMYRAFANLIAAGVQELTYTPGWAVGWWFIPLANVYKPYSAMRELWEASDPKTGNAELVRESEYACSYFLVDLLAGRAPPGRLRDADFVDDTMKLMFWSEFRRNWSVTSNRWALSC